MAIPEQPPLGRRDELLTRLEQLTQPRADGAETPAAPNEVGQAAERLAAGARELEAFVERWEQRLTHVEKTSGQATAELVRRIDGKVSALIDDARAVAIARWKHEASVFVCGAVLGVLLGFGVPYATRGEALAREAHEVLVQILENTNARREAEAAKPAPSRPGRGR
jgi:seryl-tRNA synthetase